MLFSYIFFLLYISTSWNIDDNILWKFEMKNEYIDVIGATVDDGGDSSSVILDGSKRISKDLEGIL